MKIHKLDDFITEAQVGAYEITEEDRSRGIKISQLINVK